MQAEINLERKEVMQEVKDEHCFADEVIATQR
jgi:hypothetical protein